ncbi:MAG TPA: hypothetical protein VN641_08390 [Urbifossiella sp.]|nr:hypothetical protein [Urbifossiella sp.]
MRTVAGWSVLGVFMAGLLAFGARQDQPELTKEAPPPPPPPAKPAVKAAPGPVKAPDPTPIAPVKLAPIDPETVKLIAALGSDNYREREKAGQTLEARGDKVLNDLRRSLATVDKPEVSRRLAGIVRRMEYQRLVAPKRVTFTMKKKTAKEAVDEIAKQTGYKIEFNNGNAMPAGANLFDFEFHDSPFWVAIDKVADSGGLGIYADYGDDIIRVNSYQDAYNPHVCYAGPFRFVATNINANRGVQLSGISRRGFQNRNSENIGLSFQVHSEPKNPILGSLPAEVISATDENGGNLVPPKDNNNFNHFRSSYYGGNGYRTHNAYGNLNFARANKDAKTIKKLKGKMGIVLLAGVIPEVVIDNPVKAKKKVVAGRNAEVTFESMTEANGQYTVSVAVRKLGNQDPNNVDYNWINTVWQKLELEDAAGKKYHCYGPNQINNQNNLSVSLVMQFGTNNRQGMQEKLGPPVKLTFNEWLQVTHDVTFEFKDIPLP